MNKHSSPEREEVLMLLRRLPIPPGESIPPGASEETIIACEQRLALNMPQTLHEWLRICNGPCAGPGGITGIAIHRKSQDIEAILMLHPNWLRNGWIPVAGDGCGNYYVISSNGEFGPGEPVFFIDIMENDATPAFIAASNIYRFLKFLFKKELDETTWPYDRATVECEDPEIFAFHDIALPWNA